MRILHAADFHLDSPFRGLSAAEGRRRREEGRSLLWRMAEIANDRGAELVLLSGDLFDADSVYRETMEQLRGALASIRCPVVIAPGNHDPYHARSPYRSVDWPENVHLFTSAAPEAVQVGACTVYGAAFTAQERLDSPLAGFHAGSGGLSIMCVHADLNPGPYGPITGEQIAGSGLTYLALGHVHQYSGLRREGGTYYAYPGCPEGRGFDETGEKGVLFGSVEQSGVELEFVPLSRRRYTILTADVTGREAAEALEETLRGCRQEDMVRVVFTGERGESTLRLPVLQEAFAQRCSHLELVDQTRVSEDIWSRAGEDSLRGLFLKELRRRYDEAESDEERGRVVSAVRMGLAALDNRDF